MQSYRGGRTYLWLGVNPYSTRVLVEGQLTFRGWGFGESGNWGLGFGRTGLRAANFKINMLRQMALLDLH